MILTLNQIEWILHKHFFHQNETSVEFEKDENGNEICTIYDKINKCRITESDDGKKIIRVWTDPIKNVFFETELDKYIADMPESDDSLSFEEFKKDVLTTATYDLNAHETTIKSHFDKVLCEKVADEAIETELDLKLRMLENEMMLYRYFIKWFSM